MKSANEKVKELTRNEEVKELFRKLNENRAKIKAITVQLKQREEKIQTALYKGKPRSGTLYQFIFNHKINKNKGKEK